MKRECALLMCLCLLLLCIPGCRSEEGALPVVSKDYDGVSVLIPGELTQSQIDATVFLEHPDYDKYACEVSAKGGVLCVNRPTAAPTSHCLPLNGGYFLGVDLGEFDGWVQWYPYHANDPNTVTEPQSVTLQNCLGMIDLGTGNDAYMITYEYMGKGVIWRLRHDGNAWTWEGAAEWETSFVAYCYDAVSETIYLCAPNVILSYTEAQGLRVIARDTELLRGLKTFTSLVRIADTLYCGHGAGVYALALGGGEEVWYPLEKSLKK